jgi:hypothetical protein
MTDQPPEQKPGESFRIPEPKIEELKVSVADSMSLADAAQEYRGFQSRSKSALTRPWWDWLQSYLLKLLLFSFVVGINIWWTRNVLKMVWLSGSQGSYFHLDNNVLIALVSTSIASFLGLVAIVAKNLFPDSSR